MHKNRPQIEDVRDSMTAIHRIKETYKLKSSDMARGLLDGVQYKCVFRDIDKLKFFLIHAFFLVLSSQHSTVMRWDIFIITDRNMKRQRNGWSRQYN